jgi:hypothetical protein
MWMKVRRLILIAALCGIVSTLAVPPAHAQVCTQLTWGETHTRSFVFTYQEAAPLGRELAERYGEALDAEFNRFASLFETSLPVPIMVRIYPNERDYYCFNALAAEIPVGQTHSHIGGREIALIAQNIASDPEAWEIEGLEALRNELAVLFRMPRTRPGAACGNPLTSSPTAITPSRPQASPLT